MIEVQHLTKRYGTHTAVRDLSFTIEPGRIYGFLGPNGAGKSTTMNILTGCLAATSGQVLIDGCDIFEQPLQAKRKLGYLPEQPPLYLDMTPQEYLCFVAEAKGVSKKERRAQVDRVVETTSLGEVRSRLIRHLSKGYRQRVGIAQAILGSPEVIILDEPTVGLDPLQIIEIRDLIRRLGQEHTVILSSHILPEVQAVCGSILIIAGGRLVASDTTENLEKLAGKTTVALSVRAPEPAVRAVLAGIPGIAAIEPAAEREPDVVSLVLTAQEGADLREPLFHAFAGKGLPLLRLSANRATLEDVFLELTAPAEETPPEEIPPEEPQTDAPGEDAPEQKGGEDA